MSKHGGFALTTDTDQEIARRLGVAKSSVSVWVRDVELAAEQHAALLEQNSRTSGSCAVDMREGERFSLCVADLPSASLRPSVNRYSISSKRKKRFNRIAYGTCRLVVNRTAIAQHICRAIQEYGAFERQAWLE